MEPTEIRQSRAIPALFGAGVLVLGLVLGLVARPVASWLVGLLERTPLPTHELLEVLADLPLAWTLPIGALLGLVGAVLLALSIVHESLKLTIVDDHLEYQQEDREGWIERTDVASIYPDGRYAVVLDQSNRMLARLDADALNLTALAGALTRHGYPWRESDPFERDYQRWVDGRPGFSAAENRVLQEWKRVRRKNAQRVAVDAELREADLVVREREGRVEVRRGRVSSDGPDRRPAAS